MDTINSIGYYYCPIETFFSIIINKELWFSDPLKMNDPEEASWFFDKIVPSLGEESNSLFQIRSTSLTPEMGPSTLVKKGQYRYYCLCLSKERDLLSQWRGYADQGTGVAIGLDCKAIEDAGNGKIQCTEVLYEDSIKSDFRKKELKDRIEQYKKGNSKDPFLANSDFLPESLRYKSPFYREEKEIRLIYDCYDGKGELMRNGIRERYGKQLGIINYQPIELTKEMIKEIVLGPKCALTEDMVREYLMKYKLDDDNAQILVCRSEGHYR